MIKKAAVLVFALVLISPGALFAESMKVSHTQIELVSRESSLQPGRPVEVAIRMRLDDHWHAYWRNPGDSGMAPFVQWTLPEGFEAGDLQWPYPRKFDEGGMTTYGYDQEVWLLSEIRVSESFEARTAVVLEAKVKWLVCEKICVPAKATISLEMSVEESIPVLDQNLVSEFEKARVHLPIRETAWNVNVLDDGENFMINMVPQEPSRILAGAQFFPYSDDVIDHAAEQTFKKVENGYALTVRKSVYIKEGARQLSGVLVSREGWDSAGRHRALEMDEPILKRD